LLFNSIEFLLFFVVVFFFYWKILSKSYAKQNLLLLCSSYFFYGWWDWRFLSLIIFSSFVDYFVGQKLGTVKDQTYRKGLLLISLIINLGFLAYFKYFNFFIDSFAELLNQLGFQSNRSSLNIILPVGISFYTFQALSYTIDVYRKKIEPTKDIISFLSFVAFFPQLIAGPIERASHLLPQFYKRRNFDYVIIADGLRQILWGLFKKIVIADRLAILVNTVYGNPENFDGITLIIATVFFSIQIYCDFSGYSDIAIGVAKLFGIDLRANFNFPYLSKSITEFWKRWHISLSTWFRDYLYIPLGGNKVSKIRNVFNLFIVFIISGFWHGANYTFIIWGAIHGLLLVIEKFTFKKQHEDDEKLSISNIFRMLITYLIVTFAWIFFRANNLSDAIYVVKNIFNFNLDNLSIFYESGSTVKLFGMNTLDFYLSLFFIIILFIFEINSRQTNVWAKVKSYSIYTRWTCYTLFTIVILWFGKFGFNQFIYFQF